MDAHTQGQVRQGERARTSFGHDETGQGMMNMR
jgi:hypothetical protein